MPYKLPDGIKSLVIQQWLQGRPRNEIAAQNGLSSGAVTNIVNEWRYTLGLAAADELRELAVTMKKVGITASQCALGSRIATSMLRIGINEESFETFALGVYNSCKDIGLSPESISSHIQDLVEFSKDVLPLSKIPGYLKEKKDEKSKLEQEIGTLNAEISRLKQEKKDCEHALDQALKERDMTISELKWYSDLKAELRKYSIQIDDISEFARLVNNIRQHSNYQVDKVINEFWSLDMLRTAHEKLQKDVHSLKNDINSLEQQRTTLEVIVNMHNQANSAYKDLKAMGFGLNELNFLFNMINEIAVENDIPPTKAVRKFLSDVEEQYDKKVAFEDKLHKMSDDLNNLRKEKANLRTELQLNPLIGPKLVKLTQSGLSEQDIINVASLIEKYAARGNIISDLEKYGGLKSAVQRLTQELDTLKKDTASLISQKEVLEQNNQRMLSCSNHLGNIVDFLQGIAFSLRSEILSLSLIYMFTMCSVKLQFDDTRKLQSARQFNEFAALSRSNKGEEDVPIKEVKEDVTKAIQVLLNRLGPNDEALAADLLIAYNALTAE